MTKLHLLHRRQAETYTYKHVNLIVGIWSLRQTPAQETLLETGMDLKKYIYAILGSRCSRGSGGRKKIEKENGRSTVALLHSVP